LFVNIKGYEKKSNQLISLQRVLMVRMDSGKIDETSLGAAYGFCDLIINDAMTFVHVTEPRVIRLDKINMVTY